jgi:hypothetical protein
MCADMYSQGASLDEALVASWCHAGVRSLIGVNSEMSLEIRFSVEVL